jgi:hypothetical protein
MDTLAQRFNFGNISRNNAGKSLPIICVKQVGVGAASQRLIPTGEQSGLRMRIVAAESVSLCALIKS